MGKILIINQFVFFIYSSDQFEDRLHIHVRDGSKSLAKFWLEPDIELFSNDGFSDKDINKISKLIKANLNTLTTTLKKLYGRKA